MYEYPEFKPPFTAILSGPTGSGKTFLCRKFIEHCKDTCSKVIWCYGEWQDIYNVSIKGVHIEYNEG
ncbi:hypothetical protein B4U79_18682, partial [Dinothrombium tinctorium]